MAITRHTNDRAGSGVRLWARLVAGLLILLLALSGSTAVIWAQAPSLPASAVMAAPPAAAAAADADTGAVRLLVGRSQILDVQGPVSRVSLTSADVADVMVTSPSQLLINGKLPGTISMFVWDKGGALRRYEVVVQRDLARLGEQMHTLFPGEQIEVQSNGRNIVLSGKVSNKDVIEKAVDVAAGYVDKRDEVVPLLQLQPNAPSNQVLLRVRFAEVSRSAMTELGASLFTGPNGYKNYLARTTTQQYAAPTFDNSDPNREKLNFSDFLNFFLFDQKNQLGAVVKALQTKGMFQSLAEPNLVAESGKEASFLAGGEFPIPVAQGSGSNVAINVVFKEFGIRLNFTPTVIGDRVHLKVRPEVSTLDFTNAVTLQGFRIPALSTRRTETELELQNHQTFAIAGLLSNSTTKTLQKVPGIGDIPILGLLFKSEAAQKEQTELVVMITPEILPNNSQGVTPNLPRTPEPYMPALPANKTFAAPPEPFVATRPGAGAASLPVAVPMMAAEQPAQTAPVPSPATAAATISALSTPAPKMVDVQTTPAASPVAAPAVSTMPAPSVPAPSVQDQKAFERTQRQEDQKAAARAKDQLKADQKVKEAQEKRAHDEALKLEKQSKIDAEKRDKLAREQAKRDAEAAKRAQETAKKVSENNRKQDKAVAEASARLKQAEDAYVAEVAKRSQQ